MTRTTTCFSIFATPTAAILFSIGLLTLGVTGVYLWFKNYNERWIGSALLLGGAGVAAGLIVSMRWS